MYVDQHGREIKQVSVWLPVALYRLVRADRLNLSQFIRDQLDVLYDDRSAAGAMDLRARLIQCARESAARQQAIADESREARDRLLAMTRQLREERMAERTQQQEVEVETASRLAGIRDALDAVIAEGSFERYWKALPENDPPGYRIDDWDLFLAGVARRCGTKVDPAEVAAEVRRRAAREAGP